jgi:hypothetical protein
VEFGSRIAVLARPRATLAAWTDTRNQDVDGFGQDVFSTEAEVPGRKGVGPVWLVVGVGGASLVGGAGLTARRRRRRASRPSTVEA